VVPLVGAVTKADRRLAVGIAAALLAVAGAPAAQAYTFGEPGVRQTGAEVRVFDWTTQKCEDNDFPDQAAKAFRDAAGQVVLIDTHFTVRRYTGSSLASVAHSCPVLMRSHNSADPSLFNDKEWLGSTWTEDGSTVHGLVHSEYQGYNHGPGYCIRSGETFAEKQQCWYNTYTLAKSTNGGATFTHATPPSHFVAGPSYQYARGIGPVGYFQPSNIVRGRDGYLYVLAHVQEYGVQPVGSCPMRTNNIDDPRSWRLWDGSGFTRTSVDPYRTPGLNPADHVCQPASPHIGTLSESLTWSTYFKKWLLVGAWAGPRPAPYPDSGFYYFTSDDLVNWSSAKLVMNGRLPWTYQRCTDREQIRDPSVLDPESESRNFDTTGQRPFIYFTRFQINASCNTSLDRDLIRIPLEFTNRQPGGPQVNPITVSDSTPQPGDTVNFTASAADTDGGRITAYKWDLDGDGSYERDTGTNAVTTKTYTAHEKLTVTVRVCDNDRKATDETMVVNVGSAPLQEPAAQLGSNSTGGDCPIPDTTAPQTTIDSNPAAATTSTAARFTFSANEPGTFSCSLDGAAPQPCTSPRDFTNLAFGPHTFQVRATDQAGNTDPTPASYTWTVEEPDTTAPDTAIGSKPDTTTNSITATFTFSANEPAEFSCSLDGAATQPCSSPAIYPNLTPGRHTFTVFATDRSLNVDPTPAAHAWTIEVDNTAPDTAIGSKPDTTTTSTTATFTFAANEPGTFSCSLDGAPPQPCASPADYTNLASGQHTFEVRATDQAGNTDPTSALHTWIVEPPPAATEVGPAATQTPPGKSAQVGSSGAKLAKLSIVGKPKARTDGSLLLKVKVPAAGMLVVRGKGERAAIKSANKRATKAGTVHVAVRPSAAGLKSLRRKRAVKVRTTLVFTSVSGKTLKSTRTLTLKRVRPL
jgi:hypothetical protein